MEITRRFEALGGEVLVVAGYGLGLRRRVLDGLRCGRGVVFVVDVAGAEVVEGLDVVLIGEEAVLDVGHHALGVEVGKGWWFAGVGVWGW